MEAAAAHGELADIGAAPTHTEVEHHLLQLGWTQCGAGDWAIALADPRIPAAERRFMTEIPLAYSGPWRSEERAAFGRTILAADERTGHN
ncbi:hypothetical protein [uncultured Agrococcus sp.]|uniref:hypothetical protein n=1 Tax=uncultured Agrococcus sp. TaxID=382258 RepID=UPI0025D1F6D2|nr:hypothetical protein [uncultured Agrococcus sp.]